MAVAAGPSGPRDPARDVGLQAFPPVYVIHARMLVDREAYIRRQLDALGLPFEWVLDSDPDEIGVETDLRYFHPCGDLLLPPHKSCALKHVEAMRRIRDRGQRRALVLEDDVFLYPGFLESLREILTEADQWPGPHVVDIGTGDNARISTASLVRSRRLYPGRAGRCSEAYLLGAEEAERRLAWIEANKMHLPIDHTFDEADGFLGIPRLWAEPPLAEQGSVAGRFRSSISPQPRNRWRARAEFAVQRFKYLSLYRWLGLR